MIGPDESEAIGPDESAATLSRRDTLRFNATQTVPQLLRGTFTQRPGMSSFLARRLADPQGIRLVTELRRRYGSDYLWLSVAGKRSLLVLHPDACRAVLDASPDVYGPPDVKVRGMSHFQPGAVTISTGEAWQQRRAFNEEVLASGTPVHPDAGGFLDEVERMVGGLTASGSSPISWADLLAGFRSMTAAIVFGPTAQAESVLRQLDELMARANLIVPSHDPARIAAFQRGIRESVAAASAGSLGAASCPHVTEGDPLPVAGQVPHWLFAMKGTLAINCAYALALVAADPEAQERVCEEAAGLDLADPEAVDGLRFTEGCLREAMRLWPTTPLLVREAMHDTDLRGTRISQGEQVIIHNGFNHRHPEGVPEPDLFLPDRWEPGVWDYRFNHLSNGPQACAGRDLVLLLGKAVLGRLFRAGPWRLASPSLTAGARVPHAFDHTALVLLGVAATTPAPTTPARRRAANGSAPRTGSSRR